MQKILISIMMLIFSSNVFAVELWQGLESGATFQEITKKFPSAKIVNPKLYNSFRMNNYVIFDKDFEVIFIMKNKKLNSVMLHTTIKKHDRLYSKVFDALSLKYGVPSKKVYTPLGSSAAWSYNGIEISLLGGTYGELEDSVSINYNTKLTDNANKL